MPSPLLIPQPKSIDEGPSGAGAFALKQGVSILIAHGHEKGEWIAAQQVKAALRQHGVEAPIQPQIVCNDIQHSIILAVRGRDEAVFPDAKDEHREVPDGDNLEAYALAVTAGHILVWGATPAGLARGVQTLRQLLATAEGALPAMHIADAPVLAWRGAMLDISRGKIPTLDTLKHCVDVLASFKLNVLQLYTEHSFASRRHPRIGLVWGSLTPEELVALDQYCRERYVELMPCLQSFGHLRRILDLPEYEHLAESEEHWSLAPTNEGSYTLLDDLYADHLACFTSRNFNVCSDETYDLGMGQSKELAERIGNGRLYLDHILRLHKLVEKYGRTMMIWDDIFLNHPALVREIPKNVILLNWNYEAADDYPQVEGFHEAGLRQVVCPGTSSWNTLFPRLANSRANIRNFVAAGLRVGAIGVLNTDWGDGGHANLLGSSWYGFAYGASEGWAPGVLTDDEFERRFTTLFFGKPEAPAVLQAIRALAEACTQPGVARANGSYSMQLFHDDPLENEHCQAIGDAALAAMRQLGLRAASLLHGVQTSGHDEATRTLAEYRLAANLVVYAAERAMAARGVAAAADSAARRILDLELQRLKRDLHALRLEYQWIWLARNKPDGIWLTLDQFDSSARDIDSWHQLLKPGYYWEQ
jgi:hexosaminidase